MSADNYNWVDLHPDNEPNKRWSVTNGFMSDDDPPKVPNGSTRWFKTFTEADLFAESDWTEYGARLSPNVFTHFAALLDKEEQ